MLLHAQASTTWWSSSSARRAGGGSVRVAAGARRLRAPDRDGHHRHGRQVHGPDRGLQVAVEALAHAGVQTGTRVEVRYLDSRISSATAPAAWPSIDAILVPGGFGERGIEGKIAAVRYAREHGCPILGICLGMQVAVIEYARNVAGLEGAHSTEFVRDAAPGHRADHRVADRGRPRETATRMRTRAAPCASAARTAAWSRAACAPRHLRPTEIRERHRHRYEFNNRYLRQAMKDAGMRFSGWSLWTPWWRSSRSRITLVRRLPVPSGVHLDAARRPSAVYQLHSGRLPARGGQARRR
jgi:hypothetical protein